MVNYIKNKWNDYDESKTFAENLRNDAVITLEKAENMEQGIYNANRMIETGEIRFADDNESPNVSVVYRSDAIVMNYVLPKNSLTPTDIDKVIDKSKDIFKDIFSRVYKGPKNENIDANPNDIMLILSNDGRMVEAIRTFTHNMDGTVTHTDLKLKVDIMEIDTTEERQFITGTEKKKLDGIEDYANNYIHPDGDGYKHIPPNGTQNNGKHLTATSTAGVYTWENITKQEVVDALGYTPLNKDEFKLDLASSTKDGLMSKEHFVKLNDVEEGANNYVHPTSHPASMITQDATHRFLTDDEKALLYYTNTEPMLTDHGGLKANTTFDHVPLPEIIGDILYPYTPPAVSCTVTSPANSGTYEAGIGCIISSVRVNITKKSKSIKSIQLFATDDLNNPIAERTSEDIKPGGTFTFSISKEIKNIVSNLKIRAKVIDDNNTVVNADSGAFNIVYPIYYGAYDTNIDVNITNIKSLNKVIQVKGNKVLAFTTNNQRIAFAYPKSYGVLNSIIDPNNFNITDTFERIELSIPSSDGNIVSYYIYINQASTVSGFNISFKY